MSEIGPTAALIVLLTLAAVLLVSGVAKLRDPRATRDAFDALRVPAFVPADTTARALPWAEIVLAVALLALPAPWSVVGALAVLLVMLAYTAVIARALTFDEPVTCSCFGSIGRHDVDRLTLGRNVLLSLLAGAASWFALDGGSGPAAIADLDEQGWSVLVAAVAAAVVAVLVAGVRTSSASAPSVRRRRAARLRPAAHPLRNRVPARRQHGHAAGAGSHPGPTGRHPPPRLRPVRPDR